MRTSSTTGSIKEKALRVLRAYSSATSASDNHGQRTLALASGLLLGSVNNSFGIDRRSTRAVALFAFAFPSVSSHSPVLTLLLISSAILRAFVYISSEL